jgi:hypothetical protein
VVDDSAVSPELTCCCTLQHTQPVTAAFAFAIIMFGHTSASKRVCRMLLPAGAVECWLLQVEAAMKQAVHSLARESLTAYPKSARTSWILQWPSQLVLNCSQASCAAGGVARMRGCSVQQRGDGAACVTVVAAGCVCAVRTSVLPVNSHPAAAAFRAA